MITKQLHAINLIIAGAALGGLLYNHDGLACAILVLAAEINLITGWPRKE